jgi:hypothetical protein
VIEREDSKKVVAYTRLATIDGHVFWDTELVQLAGGRSVWSLSVVQVYPFVSHQAAGNTVQWGEP